jgi:uncharacterized protein YjbI with pentapeptide repeats
MLWKTQLQAANLLEAQLQGAILLGVQLQGTNLTKAQLQGAYLFRAQLQDVDLVEAQLQGADMVSVQLQGADLSNAQLQGANLTKAQLQGSDLSDAQLQGAILYNTLVQGVKGTSKTAVFGINGQGKLFDKQESNWSDLEKLAETIPDTKHRENYQNRIQKAQEATKSNQASIAEQNLYYAPKKIAQIVLPMVCVSSGIKDDSRLAAIQAFRHQYLGLQNKNKSILYFRLLKGNLIQNPDYPALLKDIDRKLCTLKECADLRADIEGLDCKPYLENTTKKP